MKDILIDGKQYPLFCGGEDEHVDDFTCNLEMCFKLDKVKYGQKIDLFTRVLRGSAQDWFEGLPTSMKVSWRDVVEAFCMHFGVKISPWIFRFKDIVFEEEQDSLERSIVSHDEEHIVEHVGDAMMDQHTIKMACIQEEEAFVEPEGDSWHDIHDDSSVMQDLCELVGSHDIQGIQEKGHLHEGSLEPAHLKVKEEVQSDGLVDDACWSDVDILSIHISTWCGSMNHDKHTFGRLGYDGILDRSSWMLSCTHNRKSHEFEDEKIFPFDPGGFFV